MPAVIDTYSDYLFYLQYRRRAVPHTIKSNKLALQYFSSVYGDVDTKKLLPTHMVRFHEFLLERKRIQKNKHGKYEKLSGYSVYKVMIKLRAYIKRLKNEGLLWDLDLIDVPVGIIPRPLPKYLTKDELKIILTFLDRSANEPNLSPFRKYNAYLYRAVVRTLYTTWLRNSELRMLKLQDINLDNLTGAVLGKGNKYATITFSETAAKHLITYLDIRRKTFPNKAFEYVFTTYVSNKPYGIQSLNQVITAIGKQAWLETWVNTHKFRHSLGTHLAQSGCNIVDVRDKLRHSSLSVTTMYTHSSPFQQISLTKSIDTNILDIKE